MRTTFDAVADAAFVQLVPEIRPGRVERTVEVPGTDGMVMLDIDRDGILLGLEVLTAQRLLDPAMIAAAERIDLR